MSDAGDNSTAPVVQATGAYFIYSSQYSSSNSVQDGVCQVLAFSFWPQVLAFQFEQHWSQVLAFSFWCKLEQYWFQVLAFKLEQRTGRRSPDSGVKLKESTRTVLVPGSGVQLCLQLEQHWFQVLEHRTVQDDCTSSSGFWTG